MRRITILLYLLLIWGSAQAQERGVHRVVLQATTQNEKQLALYNESHALLIGVSEYTQWPRLDSIPAELDEVEQALIAQDFNVIRLRNPKGRELSNGIEDFINEYGYEHENRLLIYFSGHGHSIGNKGFLIPADTPLPEDKGFRRETVPMSRVMSWARDMEAKHALFLFDSCFSGSVFKSRNLPNASDRYIRQATAEPVRQFITAGGANEVVPAKSTFTPALVRAIKGEGDLNKDGYITGSELGVHLAQLVPRYVNQTPQYGKIKDYDLAQGDFVFFRQEIRQPPQAPIVSDQSLEALLWQSAERGNTVEEYQAYVDKFPNGTFTFMAKTRIVRLKRSQVPVEEEQRVLPIVPRKGTLTVRVNPPDARVRIMNIVPRYRDGIKLELNKSYDVLVTREGYKSDRLRVRLTQQNQTENITLERLLSLDADQKTIEVNLPAESKVISESAITALVNPLPNKKENEKATTLRSECSDGNAASCNTLGFMYENGKDVEQDASQAATLYNQACDGGNANGCSNLGFMYKTGYGVEMDVSRAGALYKKGCSGTNAAGCAYLGLMYKMGVNVKQDVSRAIDLYKQACRSGDATACSSLGLIYENGNVVTQDVGRAVALYKQACKRGDAFGCQQKKKIR